MSQPSPKVLGIDIGGSGIKAALVDVESGTLLEVPVYAKTPWRATPRVMLPRIEEVVRGCGWSTDVGCGFPGVMKGGEVLFAPNMSKKWIGVNVLQMIEKVTSGGVVVVNDADAAGIAEMEFGAGRERCRPGGGVVVMITFGTGIGTAIFVDGRLHPNSEMGHIEIGGIEAEAVAAAIARKREGISWEEWGGRVDRFLNAVELLLSPDLFIVGGGVSESWDEFFPYLTTKTPVVRARMGNNAGIVGAALAVNRLR